MIGDTNRNMCSNIFTNIHWDYLQREVTHEVDVKIDDTQAIRLSPKSEYRTHESY